MERFILRLKALQLARIDSGPMGSIFVPMGVSDSVPDSVSRYLGSKSDSDKVPRYGESPRQGKSLPAIGDPDDVRLIAAANDVLKDRDWPVISLDNFGSVKAAKKMLAVVPCDRAIPLLEQAVRLFNPSATDGEPLRSLGHPFITRYVINEFRRTERDLAQGQLSMFFVERTGPPQQSIAGSRNAEILQQGTSCVDQSASLPPAPPAAVDAVARDWRAIAAADERPARR